MTIRKPIEQAIVEQSETSVPVEHKDADLPVIFNEVPLDLAEFFGVDVRDIDNNTKMKLNEIWRDVSEITGSKGVGDILLEISRITTRLGESNDYADKITRLWSWLKINKKVNSLLKHREALENGDKR